MQTSELVRLTVKELQKLAKELGIKFSFQWRNRWSPFLRLADDATHNFYENVVEPNEVFSNTCMNIFHLEFLSYDLDSRFYANLKEFEPFKPHLQGKFCVPVGVVPMHNEIMIKRTINELMRYKAHGVIFLPKMDSKPWFHEIINNKCFCTNPFGFYWEEHFGLPKIHYPGQAFYFNFCDEN
mgnify:CR=1 FL=1